MIIARIRGGLGNQLFQYAAARALAWKKGEKLKLDLYTYGTKSQSRSFGLDRFHIDAEIASRKEVHQFTGSNFLTRYMNKQENYLRCPAVLSQPHYHFYEDFFSVPTPIYLSGYWQSEKYFKEFETQLKSQFVLKNNLSESPLKWKQKMQGGRSVAVHIRRGDYSSKSNYNSFFGTLSFDYYERAIKEMKAKIGDPTFFIFSDDIDWCKQNLKFLSEAEFITHDTNIDASEDLILMSLCQHQIIANSTFSWWGAWLNSNQSKIVVAPSKWFQTIYNKNSLPTYAARFYNTKDLIPENWIRL
jgi:hypothetical protein